MRARFLAVAGLAVAGAQAGHLLAYQLRFGAAAQQIQATGAHAYFPAFVKTALGVAALSLIGGLLIVAVARVAASGPMARHRSRPSFIGVLATLFTFQLVLFMTQEAIESLVAGLPPTGADDLLLWGTVGQLPVAIAGTAVLTWLGERVEDAVAFLGSIERASSNLVLSTPVALQPIFVDGAIATAHAARSRVVKRGPPLHS